MQVAPLIITEEANINKYLQTIKAKNRHRITPMLVKIERDDGDSLHVLKEKAWKFLSERWLKFLCDAKYPYKNIKGPMVTIPCTSPAKC